MADYINKKDAMEQSCYACDGYPCPFPCPSYRAMDNLPTIDIVRCEVCKYWSLEKELTRLNGERYTVGYCCLEDKYSDCDWFCADGKRKPTLKHADNETLQSAT